MAHVLRTHTTSETRGFMKVLVEAGGEKILGFTAFGPEAGEVMAAVQVAMAGGLLYTVLRDAVIAFSHLFLLGTAARGAEWVPLGDDDE
jgi:pyruvate/2-oxoglutarate dehydrogenase complex dihydrolipoamide dehydrogenase (E3) component